MPPPVSESNQVQHLEAALPLIDKLGPVPLYFDFRNSYAIEQAEVGHIDIALEAITPVIASPYVPFYPNWPETLTEIQEKSTRRSRVIMNKSNVIPFPTKEEEVVEEPEAPYDFRYSKYITNEFDLRDKIEDWVFASAKPDDLGTLFVALSETPNQLEHDLIVEQVIETTFHQTPEAHEAKERWRSKLSDKIK